MPKEQAADACYNYLYARVCTYVLGGIVAGCVRMRFKSNDTLVFPQLRNPVTSTFNGVWHHFIATLEATYDTTPDNTTQHTTIQHKNIAFSICLLSRLYHEMSRRGVVSRTILHHIACSIAFSCVVSSVASNVVRSRGGLARSQR